RSNGGRSIEWVWRNGPALPMATLGNPTAGGDTGYALCVRDGSGTLVFHEQLAAGGSCNGRPCWHPLGTRGFAYKNGKAVNAVASLKLTATGRTGSQIAATARGPSLFESAPPLAFPVTVQLEADTGTCWSATFQTGSRARRGGHRRPY